MAEAVFRMAQVGDESELRRLTALPMPGDWIQLRYERSPDYFAAATCPEQVMVGRFPQGDLAAMAVRASHQVYLNGQKTRVGYLSGLRVDPRFQGKTMLWRGFELLRQLNLQDPVAEHLATIIDGNQMAQALLVRKPRPSWPRFSPHGHLVTLALKVGRKFSLQGLDLQPDPLPTLQEWGPRQHFFPADGSLPEWEVRRWVSLPEGIMALRDLSARRQTRVHSYQPWLARLRWLYNGLFRPALPAPGELLRGAFAGFVALDGCQPSAFRRLLQGLLELAREGGYSWLYLGLNAFDPHLAVAQAFPHRAYRSQIYRVHWHGEGGSLDGRPTYLELASL